MSCWKASTGTWCRSRWENVWLPSSSPASSHSRSSATCSGSSPSGPNSMDSLTKPTAGMRCAVRAASIPTVVARRASRSPHETEIAGRSSTVKVTCRLVTVAALAIECLLEDPQHVELDRSLLLRHVAAVPPDQQGHEVQLLHRHAQLVRAVEPVGVLAEDQRLVEQPHAVE